MTTTTRTRKPVQPVHGKCRWTIQPIPCRDFLVGALAINADEYTVTITRKDGNPQGVRLTKPDGTVYHVDLSTRSCDCPDASYRPRPGGCKHLKATVAALAVAD